MDDVARAKRKKNDGCLMCVLVGVGVRVRVRVRVGCERVRQ